MGLVLTATLTLVLPAPVVLALVAPLMNLSDPVALRYYWRRWDARQLRLLAPATLVGIVLGTWWLAHLAEPALRRLLGALALTVALLQLAAGSWSRVARAPGRLAGHWTVGVAAGLATGVASAVAHSGGVVLALYLLAARLEPAALVGTTAALVALANGVKLAGYWAIGFLGPRVLGAALLAAPLLVLGGWLGYRVNRRLPRPVFERVVLAIAIAGALRLLLA